MSSVSPDSPGLAIIVMGVSGSGKSTVGAGLAKLLTCPYLEGDRFHSTISIEKMAAGIPLGDEDRWPWLARLTSKIDEVVSRHGCVVASCSALKRAYRDKLREEIGGPIVFIHLVTERTHLESRVSSRNSHYMPASLLQSQLQSLEPPTGDEDALKLVNDTDVDSAIRAAHDWVRSRSIPC